MRSHFCSTMFIEASSERAHRQDPHELASWVNQIAELEPATPQPPVPHCPIPPPPAAESGQWGTGGGRGNGDRLACKSDYRRGKLVGVGREQKPNSVNSHFTIFMTQTEHPITDLISPRSAVRPGTLR